MVCGWVMSFFSMFIPLSMLMFTELYTTLWTYRTWIVLFAVTKLILIVLRSLVADVVLNTNGEVTWPITFSCVWVVLIVINFAIGILASICRFFLLLPAVIYRFNSLDQTMLSE